MGTPEIFWDTCVFGAHLYGDKAQYGATVDHIEQFLREAQDGKWKIVTSSVLFAEIAFSKVKKGAPGKLEDLVADLSSACLIIEPNPNIMILAGKLRDIPYRKGKSEKRVLSVPDAIMLATAIYGQEYFSDFRGFFTFDAGGAKRSIPLIGYEDWLEGISGPKRQVADQVVRMNRLRPEHPTPELGGI